MELLWFVALGIIGAILALIIKQYKPEFAIMITVMVVVIMLAKLIGIVTPLVSEIKEMMREINVSFDYIVVLIKAVGICYLVQFACDVCKDAGQISISSKIELVGKIGICAVALPLYKDLLEIVRTIIGKVT